MRRRVSVNDPIEKEPPMSTPRENTIQAKSAKKAEKPDDAIKLLMTDHREVESLFEKFEEAKEDNAEKDGVIGRAACG